jgi:hypothetical protein
MLRPRPLSTPRVKSSHHDNATKSQPQPAARGPSAKPTAPSTLQRWFPAGVWLREYDWGKFTALDLIAAVIVAALPIPESMGYATVAGVPAQISACTQRRWR